MARQRPSCRLAHRIGALAGDFDRARRRAIEAADQIQQRRFAGPDGPIEREEVAFRNVQIQRLQHMHRFRAALVILRNAREAVPEFSVIHASPHGRPSRAKIKVDMSEHVRLAI